MRLWENSDNQPGTGGELKGVIGFDDGGGTELPRAERPQALNILSQNYQKEA